MNVPKTSPLYTCSFYQSSQSNTNACKAALLPFDHFRWTYGQADQRIRLPAWGFLLVFTSTCTVWSKKTDPLVYFDDNFGKYGSILTIFSPLQQEIHDAQKLSYFNHLTFIMLPLYLAKQTLMLVSMLIFLDHASKQISMYSNG